MAASVPKPFKLFLTVEGQQVFGPTIALRDRSTGTLAPFTDSELVYVSGSPEQANSVRFYQDDVFVQRTPISLVEYTPIGSPVPKLTLSWETDAGSEFYATWAVYRPSVDGSPTRQVVLDAESRPGNTINFENNLVLRDTVTSSVTTDTWPLVMSATGDTTLCNDYMYTRSGITWSETQQLVFREDPNSGDMSDDGNVVVLGNDSNGSPIGIVSVFAKTGSTWTHRQDFTRLSPLASGFGPCAISGDGNVIAIGEFGYPTGATPPANEEGAVHIYDIVAGSPISYSLTETIVGNSLEQLGSDVALSSDGTYLLAEAAAVGSDNATLFIRQGGVYVRKGSIASSATGYFDFSDDDLWLKRDATPPVAYAVSGSPTTLTLTTSFEWQGGPRFEHADIATNRTIAGGIAGSPVTRIYSYLKENGNWTFDGQYASQDDMEYVSTSDTWAVASFNTNPKELRFFTYEIDPPAPTLAASYNPTSMVASITDYDDGASVTFQRDDNGSFTSPNTFATITVSGSPLEDATAAVGSPESGYYRARYTSTLGFDGPWSNTVTLDATGSPIFEGAPYGLQGVFFDGYQIDDPRNGSPLYSTFLQGTLGSPSRAADQGSPQSYASQGKYPKWYTKGMYDPTVAVTEWPTQGWGEFMFWRGVNEAFPGATSNAEVLFSCWFKLPTDSMANLKDTNNNRGYLFQVRNPSGAILEVVFFSSAAGIENTGSPAVAAGGRYDVYLAVAGVISSNVFGQDGAGNDALTGSPAPVGWNDNEWHHIMMTRSGSTTQLYVDNTKYLSTAGTSNWDWTNTNSRWMIAGGRTNNPQTGSGSAFDFDFLTGMQRMQGTLAGLYLAQESLNLDNADNRRLFIRTNGFAEDLGDDGSVPTGSQPLLYFERRGQWRNDNTYAGSPTLPQTGFVTSNAGSSNVVFRMVSYNSAIGFPTVKADNTNFPVGPADRPGNARIITL